MIKIEYQVKSDISFLKYLQVIMDRLILSFTNCMVYSETAAVHITIESTI